jgi:hypothetical protein
MSKPGLTVRLFWRNLPHRKCRLVFFYCLAGLQRQNISLDKDRSSCAYRKHLQMEGLSEFVAPFITAAQPVDLEKDELDVVSARLKVLDIEGRIPICRHKRTLTVFTSPSMSARLIASC